MLQVTLLGRLENRSAMRRLIALALAGVGAALTPQPAAACGANPLPSYTISSVLPGEGSSGVPRDGGIVVSGAASDGTAGWLLPASVALIDVESGEAVAVREITWLSPEGAELTMAVHPEEPLAARHGYRVEATLRSDAMTRDAYGNEYASPSAVSSFATSDALLEPLVLSGGIELSLRSGEVDALAYIPCNEPKVTGKRRALIADVRLPAPSGGQGMYRGELHFSDNSPVFFDDGALDGEPHNIQLTRSVAPRAGEVLAVTQEISDEGDPYAGCFALSVWDPAGHVARAAACLPTLTADQIQVLADSDASIRLAADDATASDQVDQAVSDARTRELGCAIGSSRSSAVPAWLALLLGAALVRRPRGRGRAARLTPPAPPPPRPQVPRSSRLPSSSGRPRRRAC